MSVCIAVVAVALALRIKQIAPGQNPYIPEIPGAAKNFIPDSSFYKQSAIRSSPNPTPSAAPASPVTARAYLVGNVETGQVYLEHNSSAVYPVASMSKLITAIAATDTMQPTDIVEITPAEMDVASDTSRLTAGEKFTVNQLLYPMLLSSSNVAAEALASTSNRIKFLELMSSYAWEVGMPSTFFADPSGISPRNISTASDFFALARYLYKFRPDILAITRTPMATTATTSDHGAHVFTSIHPFVNDPAFLGGKTGHTPEAHDTMLTIMNLGGLPIAIVVLASDGRETDTRYLVGEVQKTIANK
jgi:D-alanyl-D-alanine endopeptidase (penicillin-binding protein 7)